MQKIWQLYKFMPSLHRGYANLPCNIPVLLPVLPEWGQPQKKNRKSKNEQMGFD